MEKKKGKIRAALKKPFWAHKTGPKDELPSWDFCREIIGSGVNKKFPDGALGIRVDDDFWVVAVLPLEYCDWKLEDIVADLWPHIFHPTFHADSGTIEQKVENLRVEVYHLKIVEKGYFSKIRQLEKELSKHGPHPWRKGLSNDPS